MKLLIMMSLRNLLRQKRRNILLAVIIAFGMMVLIMANGIGAGMTDITLNQVMVKIVGHMLVISEERVDEKRTVIRDKKRMVNAIKNNVDGVISVQEKIVNWTRAIGNGKSADVVVEGMELTPEFLKTLSLESGTSEEFKSGQIPNAVILTRQYAKKLNLKYHDTFNVRLNTLYGQAQTAKLYVAGITRQAASVFMENSIYIKIDELKKILGYRESEAYQLMVALKDPSSARKQADKLRLALEPEILAFQESLLGKTKEAQVYQYAFSTNESAMNLLTNNLKLMSKDMAILTNVEKSIVPGAMVSSKLANELGLVLGSRITGIYRDQSGESITNTYRVAAIYNHSGALNDNAILVNEIAYYRNYYSQLPPYLKKGSAGILDKKSPLYPALAKEWTLFPKCRTEREMQKALGVINREKKKGAILKVSTMYEEGSGILQYATLISYVTFFGVLILFMVTQIGVVNTLRMTIRERTREIGTTRALGMHREEVRKVFLMETMALTLFASFAGILLAYAGIGLISLIPLQVTTDVLSIFVLDNRLHFVTTFGSIVFYTAALLLVAFLSAYFPSRKAAELPIADALRHYE